MQGRAGTTLTAARRATAVLVAVTVVGYLLDQATKAWALTALADGDRRPILGDLLGLRLIFNPGAAFSFGTGTTWVFTIVAALVIVVIVRMASRLTSTAWALTLGLLLAGALGNLTDRLIRPPGFARGHVIDFIAYANWFVGNVADIWIVVAAVLLVLLTLLGVPTGPAPADPAGGADE